MKPDECVYENASAMSASVSRRPLGAAKPVVYKHVWGG